MSWNRQAANRYLFLTCLFIGWSAPAAAEITVLDGQPSGDWLQRLDLQVGGSIRAQYVDRMGSIDDGSYKHKGYDGGSRFRFTGKYLLTDHTRLKAYYEPGVDIPHVLNMSDHYPGDKRRISTRQRYVGIANDSWGTLTVGKQNSVYYDTVGVKTDVWDHDMQGQGPGNGINGDVDGSYRGRRLVNYTNSFGKLDLYASWILPSDTLDIPNGGPNYNRNHGGALAVNYHFTRDFEISAAYSYTDADLDNRQGHDSTHQELAGSAFLWTPGHWYIAAGGGYYHNFVPAGEARLSDYLAEHAFGAEIFVSRTFPTQAGMLTSLKPYVAADRLQRTSGPHYQSSHEYAGLTLNLVNDFRVDLERTFTQSSDDLPGENWVRVRYDF